MDPKAKYEQEWNHVGLLQMPTPAQNNSFLLAHKIFHQQLKGYNMKGHPSIEKHCVSFCFVFVSFHILLFPNMYTTYRSLRENHIHSKHNINFSLLLSMMAHQSNSSPCKTDTHFTAMKPNYNSTPCLCIIVTTGLLQDTIKINTHQSIQDCHK